MIYQSYHNENLKNHPDIIQKCCRKCCPPGFTDAARLAGIEVHSSPGDDPQQDLHRKPLNIAEEPWKHDGKTMENQS